MTAKKPKKDLQKKGRKSKKNAEAIRKIEEIAALDGNIKDMASYADVSESAIYKWIENDPELKERIGRLRRRAVLKARHRAIQGIEESYHNAMDYLKRKEPKEFGDKMEVEGMTFSPRIVTFGEDDPLRIAMEKDTKK